MLKQLGKQQGFTLIELLVVVLIIGILSAVALPQYQKAVEKARMTEAIQMLRSIANSQQVYFMATGNYAGEGELNLLDLDIPGEVIQSGSYAGRIQTKNFVYAPTTVGIAAGIAGANRVPFTTRYYMFIRSTDQERIHCSAYSTATSVQKKLCEELEKKGAL